MWSRNLSFFFERETFWSICYSLSLSIYTWTYSTYYYYYNYILLHNLKVTFPIEYILKCNLFLRCKSEFSAQLLQSSVSHDPSEIILIYWFAAQETFLIIINVKKLVCCLTFWWKIYGRKTSVVKGCWATAGWGLVVQWQAGRCRCWVACDGWAHGRTQDNTISLTSVSFDTWDARISDSVCRSERPFLWMPPLHVWQRIFYLD